MTSGDLTPVRSGAARRRVMRRFLGKPGSLRRWIVGSVVWFMLCVVLFVLTSSFYVLIIGLAADLVAFFARVVLVGDEDEFNAALQQTLVQVAREGVTPREDNAADFACDPATWFARGVGRFDGAPPPPVAEAEEESRG